MNGHHPPIETDPLGAIRKELLGAAWRQKARRDRHRRLATVTASFVLLLASVAGGASALGVDLPLIGDVLDRHAARELDRGGGGGANARVPGNPSDVEPGPGNATERLEVPWTEGKVAVGAAYLNTSQQVCFALATPRAENISASGCAPKDVVREQVDDGVAYVQGVSLHDMGVVTGYVASEAAAVRVRGPYGPLRVIMSEPWTAGSGDGKPIRAFFAVFDLGGLDTDPRAFRRVVSRSSYSIDVTLHDGRTISVRP